MQIPGRHPARLGFTGFLWILLTVSAVAVGGCSATASSAAGHARAVFPQKGQAADSAVRPKVLRVAADGSVDIRGLTWTAWGTTTASGTGTARVNDCTPNCANGHMSNEPVKVTLTKPHRVCGRRVFGEVSMTYSGRRPATFPAHQSFRLLVDCAR
jgi:hypothetical protein